MEQASKRIEKPEASAPRAVRPLHPYCNVCGWRKGGIDSWDGRRCKCGHYEPPFSEAVNAMFDRLDAIDLALTLAAERDEPLPMGEEDALRAERAELRSRLHVALKVPA